MLDNPRIQTRRPSGCGALISGRAFALARSLQRRPCWLPTPGTYVWIRTHRNLVPNSWHKFVRRFVRPCFHQIVQRARKRVSKKLLEWSYPRNWGSFVWNEEGRSEYILSLPISSPGWLHSYHTLLLQLVHPNVRNPWLFHEGCYGKLQHRLRATAVHQVGHTHSSSTKNHGPTVPCC